MTLILLLQVITLRARDETKSMGIKSPRNSKAEFCGGATDGYSSDPVGGTAPKSSSVKETVDRLRL
jgi:hypothetical protein